ncbi:MAG: hypothetical protein HQ510_13140 [Candidatus Marinimicrobia bacterium]|nr:hypothetical protein [Candidatus Neomarinimicrobiota bacterium]
MDLIKGKCTNYINCEHADNETIFEKSLDEDFICECGQEFWKVPKINTPTKYVLAVGIIGVIIVVFLLVKWIWNPISIVSSPVKKVKQGDLYSYTIKVENAVGRITFLANEKPKFLNFDDAIGQLIGTPQNVDVGNHVVNIMVHDEVDTLFNYFTLEVIDVNDIATVNWGFPNAFVDSLYNHVIEIEDIDVQSKIDVEISGDIDWLKYNEKEFRLLGTPSIADTGNNQLGVTFKDGEFVIDTTIQIFVSNLNSPPFFISNPNSIAYEKELYKYLVKVGDPDTLDVLMISIVKGPAWMSIEEGHVLRGTPDAKAVGSHEIVLSVTDGYLSKPIMQEFTLNVENINDPPVFASAPIEIATEDQEYRYEVIVTDEDAKDSINLILVKIPDWLSFYNKSLLGIPTDENIGFHQILIEAYDGIVETPTVQEFVIEVKNVNDIPLITSVPDTLAKEGQYYRYQLIIEDPDPNEEFEIQHTDLPEQWLSFRRDDLILSGKPRFGLDKGEYYISFIVDDGEATAEQSYTLVVVEDPSQKIYNTVFHDFDHIEKNASYMNTQMLREFVKTIKDNNQVDKLWIKINPQQNYSTFYLVDPTSVTDKNRTRFTINSGCIKISQDSPDKALELEYHSECSIDKMQEGFIYSIKKVENE